MAPPSSATPIPIKRIVEIFPEIPALIFSVRVETGGVVVTGGGVVVIGGGVFVVSDGISFT